MRTHWTAPLAYTITPKSGPMRAMETLLDANRAMTHDMPREWLKRPEWWQVGWTLIKAAESGAPEDIRDATDEMAKAMDREGWMSRPSPKINAVPPQVDQWPLERPVWLKRA